MRCSGSQRRIAQLLVASGALFAASSAAAAASIALSVERAPGADDCPSVEALRERIERIRHAPLSAATAASESDAVGVRVRFERASDAFHARLELHGSREGERQLSDHSPTCDALGEAVAVAIALVLDRDTGPSTTTTKPDSDATTTAAAASVAKATAQKPATVSRLAARKEAAGPSETQSDFDAARPWEFGANLEGGLALGFGATPTVSISGTARALHASGLRFELGATAVLPSRIEAGPGKLEANWLFGAAGVCQQLGARFSVAPCVWLGLGRAHGQGVGFTETRQANLFWVAPGAGLLLQGALTGALVWGLSGTMWVPLRQLTFSAENAGVLWRAPRVAGVITTGLGVNFH